MIGLGSNRLTVCRRGGMSVTQAGRGGMEWLAGGRMPSWASPYSAQATAALLAQFPTQWPTIRDYGFAHPEIVPIINQWAPIDAGLMYRLIPSLGKKLWLKRTGLAYIDTGIKVQAAYPFELDCEWVEFDSNRGCILSNYSAGNVGIGYELGGSSYVRHYFNGDKLNTGNLGLNTEHTIHSDYNAQTGVIVSVIDGTTYRPSSAVQSGTATLTLLWMTDHRVNTLSAQVQQANQRILANGIEHIYAPITNNGVVGLLDIKSDGTAEFKSNAYSSGSFEIIEQTISPS